MLFTEYVNRFELDAYEKPENADKFSIGGFCVACEKCQLGYKVSHTCGGIYGTLEKATGLDTLNKIGDDISTASCFQGEESWKSFGDLLTGGVSSNVEAKWHKWEDCASGGQTWNAVVSNAIADVASGGGTLGWMEGPTGVGASNASWAAIDQGIDKLKDAVKGSTGAEDDDEVQEQDSTDTHDEEKTETAKETAQTGQDAAETSAREMLAVGGNPATANDLASGRASELSRSQYNDLYGAIANSKASTQADYLNKMGYSNALQQQAENIKKGAGLNIASGALQGMGSGAMAGAGFSDETIKESTDSKEDEILSHIGKLIDMTTEVEKLKRRKKS